MTTATPSTCDGAAPQRPLSEWRLPRTNLGGRDMMTQLYNRLDGAYPGKWSQQFRNQQAIDNWRDAWEDEFVRAGIRPTEVAEALARLPEGWPPALPDFIALCRPALAPEPAFYQAVAGMVARQRGEMGDWSHPAVFWAAVRVGSTDLLAAGYGALRGRWEAALRSVLADGRWKPIPEPALALPASGTSRTSREEATRRISELSAQTAIKAPSARVDHKLWARKVIARVKAGERVSAVTEQKARLALGMTPTEEIA